MHYEGIVQDLRRLAQIDNPKMDTPPEVSSNLRSPQNWGLHKMLKVLPTENGLIAGVDCHENLDVRKFFSFYNNNSTKSKVWRDIQHGGYK